MDDHKYVRELFQKLKKYGEDPEQIEHEFKKAIEKRIPPHYGPLNVAAETDTVMHKLLGEAALDEISDLQNKNLVDALLEVKETSNKGLSDLEKSLNINPQVNVEDLAQYEKGKSLRGVYSPSIGTKVHSRYDTPTKNIGARQQAIGTQLHETGHAVDEVAKRLAKVQDELIRRNDPDYKIKKFRKLNVEKQELNPLEMMTNDELARYFQNIKDKFDKYVKNNPDKIEKMISTPGMSKFKSIPVPQYISPFDVMESDKINPLKAQNLYSGTEHWFRRNFPFENLKNVLKKGLKGVKGVGVSLIPAAALSAIAMYSPDSKAATIAETTKKVLDEGDPFSFLFPSEAGEGEEHEIKKMQEEAKQKRFTK